MSKSATIRARIEPSLKKEAESLLSKMGLSATQAITIFYRQIKMRKGLPFNIVIPNKTTRKTLEDTDAGRDLVVCDAAADMFRKLGI